MAGFLVVLTGASGGGKTTLARAIKERYPDECDVLFFDSVGVPSPEEMKKWGDGQFRRVPSCNRTCSDKFREILQTRLIHIENLEARLISQISLGVNHKESSDGRHIDGRLSAKCIDMLNHMVVIW